MTYALHALKNETQAVELLRQHIVETVGEDDDLIRDMAEGETSILDLIEQVVEQIAMDQALVDGIAKHITAMQARKARLEKRSDAFRVAVMTAMQTAGMTKHQTAIAALTVKDLPPKALVIEEAEIPADYWTPADPKLNKRAVLDALKAGQAVPGAQLSNGGQTIQIRWS